MNNKPKKQFIFNEDQLNLLIHYISNNEIFNILVDSKNNNEIIKNGYHTGKFYVIFDCNEQEILLDQLSELFITQGLNENDEPNQIGLSLEAIIVIVSFSDCD